MTPDQLHLTAEFLRDGVPRASSNDQISDYAVRAVLHKLADAIERVAVEEDNRRHNALGWVTPVA